MTLKVKKLDPRAMTPYWRFEYEERAAIMEVDGKLPRADAETAALVDIERRILARLP